MNSTEAVAALAALAQTTRLAAFRQLVAAGADGLAAGALAAALDIPPATLSFHLKELVHAGLVFGEQRGRFVIYRARLDAMSDLIGYLAVDCCGGSPEQCVDIFQTVEEKKCEST